jgi:streptogramin lyase
MKQLFTLFLLTLVSLLASAQTGTWKAYLSYAEPTEIEKAGSNVIYVLASGDLYSYNQNDQSLQTYDKTTVLNDCDIAHIAWCQEAQRLVIVYSNGNIDLLEPNSNVVNMADYMDASLTGDKTVNDISVNGATAYLATGFGVVQLDVADAAVANTYQLGFAVNYTYVDSGYLYAASASAGLYRGSLSANLLDNSNWSRVGDYTASTETLDPDLLALVNTLSPGGPKYNHFGFMRMRNGKLYTVPGGRDAFTDYEYKGAYQIWDGSDWMVNDEDVNSITGHSYVDITTIDVDPTDTSRIFIGGRTGLYEFYGGEYQQEFTPENSPLRGAATVSSTNKDYNMVMSAVFDDDGILWMTNSVSATTNLLMYDADEDQWTSLYKSEFTQDGRAWDNMRGMMFDSRNLLWFVNDHSNNPAIGCYQPSTDATVTFSSFVNEDGTTVSPTFIRCITEDNDQNMWIGTNVGPLMLEPDQITASSPVFTQVKVPRNDGTNYADYLLNNVDIAAIVVDKANRKWFGTKGSGVYCIASDNITQVYHFTADNSSLLSDNIVSMAINDDTGEVFFGTENGLCSYMSNANTAAEGMTKNTVWAYPNPVRPDYTGAITITGLEEDADVKIVTVNGTLVEEGRASNGQYKWYGLDKNMRRVASGVYMVEIATSEGEKGVVCKIAVVN